MRTLCDAAHTGNTFLAVGFSWVLPADCLCRTLRGAQSALHTFTSGFGNQSGSSGLFVGPVARNDRRFPALTVLKSHPNCVGKSLQRLRILRVRPTGGVLVHDGMLRYGGNGGTRLCQPPEKITLYRIYEAVDPGCLDDLVGLHPYPSALCPIGRNIRTVLAAPYGKLREDVKKVWNPIPWPISRRSTDESENRNSVRRQFGERIYTEKPIVFPVRA